MRDFISEFKPKPYQTQRNSVVLSKTTSVELEGKAGQHGVHGLGWGAVEVPTSWTCCRRVESKGEAGERTSVKLRWSSQAALVLCWGRCPHSGEGWAAKVACRAQDGAGDHCKGERQQPEGGDRVNESKDVVWEVAVIFNSRLHWTGLNSLQHSIDDGAWSYKDCILISKSKASLPLVMNTFSELQAKEIPE